MSGATAAEVLSRLAGSFEVPADARLAGISTTFGPDGSREWTITFRAPPAGGRPASAPAPPPTPSSAGASSSVAVPPLPPPLSQLQLNSQDIVGSPQTVSSAFPISPVGPQGPLPPEHPRSPGRAHRIFPLRASVMTYAWGKLGEASLVGRMACQNDADFVLGKDTPYAEMWMGTHPSGPSMVMVESPWRIITPLMDWLKLNPSMAGDSDVCTSGLPFLFKILSVRTALSIQAHPDKLLAKQLHSEKPAYYKDDNHKPEMTLAVTPFEALCSFQKVSMVLENIRACPELAAVVGDDAVRQLAAAAEKAAPFTPHWPAARWGRRGSASSVDLPSAAATPHATTPHATPHASGQPSPLGMGAGAAGGGIRVGGSLGSSRDNLYLTREQILENRRAAVMPALRELFTKLMTAEQALVERQLDALMKRIATTSTMLLTPVDELARRLHEQYPHDVGVFCAYLLNYLVLEPGEALFLAANEPHAYIFGDCVECMATSDNVVRAGLTPKFKDVDVLCSMLTYDDKPPHMVAPQPIARGVARYATPAPEFLVDRVELLAGDSATLPPAPSVSILLLLEGAGTLEEFPASADAAFADVSSTPPLASHNVSKGAVFMACANTTLRITADDSKKLLLFRATAKYELPGHYELPGGADRALGYGGGGVAMPTPH